MSRAPSGKILKYTYKKVQKNGDIYVFERETRYDPGKKYNVVLTSACSTRSPRVKRSRCLRVRERRRLQSA